MPKCTDCGSDITGNYSEDADITCGICTQFRCQVSERRAQRRLAAIATEDFVTLRKQHGWTQGDLAVKLGVPQSQVAAFEQGKDLPNAKLAEWFESEVD